jgi:hypothetical protein
MAVGQTIISIGQKAAINAEQAKSDATIMQLFRSSK